MGDSRESPIESILRVFKFYKFSWNRFLHCQKRREKYFASKLSSNGRVVKTSKPQSRERLREQNKIKLLDY